MGLSEREQVSGVGARVLGLLSDHGRGGLPWSKIRLAIPSVPAQELEGTLHRLRHEGRLSLVNGEWWPVGHAAAHPPEPRHVPISDDSAIAHLPASDMAAITVTPRKESSVKHRCNTCENDKHAAEMRQFGGKPTGICKACFAAKRAATVAKGGPGVVKAEKAAKGAKPAQTIREVVERHTGRHVLDQLRDELASLDQRRHALATAISALEPVYA